MSCPPQPLRVEDAPTTATDTDRDDLLADMFAERPRYGVHIWSHEDDWGWTAHGHHEPRRLIAAIVQLSREDGVLDDLRAELTVRDLAEGIELRWANNLRRGTYHDVEWTWCQQSDPGAMPMTWVSP